MYKPVYINCPLSSPPSSPSPPSCVLSRSQEGTEALANKVADLEDEIDTLKEERVRNDENYGGYVRVISVSPVTRCSYCMGLRGCNSSRKRGDSLADWPLDCENRTSQLKRCGVLATRLVSKSPPPTAACCTVAKAHLP